MHPERHPPGIAAQFTLADRLRRCLLVAALLGIAGTATAAQLELPAVSEPPSQERHVGKVILVELVTPDLATAERFYGGLFGWSFDEIEAGGTTYAKATFDGHPVAGLVHREIPAGERRRAAWLSFIAVGDVDKARTIALGQGAMVLFEPHSIANRGREAVFADPRGAIFAVLDSSSGDPPDELASPGEWIWSSLITSDPDADTAFYQALFAYEAFDLPADDGARHLLLASDGYARASVNPLPEGNPNAHPHWLNYVRVTDAELMAAKVVALGGRVLVEPRVDRHGGRVAVVTDPLGAPFGLLEWPNAESAAASP